MKFRFTFLMFLSFMIVAIGNTTLAQEDSGLCDGADIQDRVKTAYNGFVDEITTIEDNTAALNQLNDLIEELNVAKEICESLATGNSNAVVSEIGSGTLNDPYAFGYAGPTYEGFTITVTGLIRPADQIIYNENRFNDRAEDGQVYIILRIGIDCEPNYDGRCEVTARNFELVGDSGTIYSDPYVTYEDELDVSVFGGGSGTGDLVFLINEEDSNLRMMYYNNIYSDEFVAYAAEPSLANGIEIQAMTNVNVRNAPTTNSNVVGNLSPDSPVIVYGRNADATWIQFSMGWVLAELMETEGDIQGLPVTSE